MVSNLEINALCGDLLFLEFIGDSAGEFKLRVWSSMAASEASASQCAIAVLTPTA